jgi:hypothetical protein
MISDHDSIIKLLNGYLNRSDNDDSNVNDVFLDRHGQPTDRFLEVYHSSSYYYYCHYYYNY